MNRWLILLIVTSSTLGLLAVTLVLFAQGATSSLDSATVTSTDFYAWGIVAGDGFGDPYNQRLNTFGEFNGQLYAGTSNSYGAQIWRSTDGVRWTLASTVNSQTISLYGLNILQFAAFDGYLYASSSACGCGWHVLRSLNGTDWTLIGPRDSDHLFILMTTYSHTLYAADANGWLNGWALWQTSDGLNWQPVTHTVFITESVSSQIVFKDRFYVAFSEDGAQLWRTDGLTWEAVITNGFGITQNIYISSLGIFGDQLYAVTLNQATNLQIWRTTNGLDWTQVVSGGLGNPPHNTGAGTQLIEFQGQLFLFSGSLSFEREVWRSTDGVAWEPVKFDEWTTSRNSMSVKPVTVFSGRLLAGTGILSPTQGFKLWSYLTHPYYLPLLTLRK